MSYKARVKFNGFRWSRHYATTGNIGVEIGECNLECNKCFTLHGAKPYRHLLPSLSADEIWSELRKFRAHSSKARNTWLLRFGGGEWLLNNRTAQVMIEVMEIAIEDGYWLMLETNCIGVNEKIITQLENIADTGAFWQDCGIFASLKGIDEETFVRHTKASAALWPKSLDGARLLDTLGVPGALVVCCSVVSKARALPFIEALQAGFIALDVDYKQVRESKFVGSSMLPMARELVAGTVNKASLVAVE